jgi:hypothetical protein
MKPAKPNPIFAGQLAPWEGCTVTLDPTLPRGEWKRDGLRSFKVARDIWETLAQEPPKK